MYTDILQTAEMALKLSAVNRWCVTGTPIQKGVEGNILKVPFCEERNKQVDSKPYLLGYKTETLLSKMSKINLTSPVTFCYNLSFTLPKQSQRSRSIL